MVEWAIAVQGEETEGPIVKPTPAPTATPVPIPPTPTRVVLTLDPPACAADAGEYAGESAADLGPTELRERERRWNVYRVPRLLQPEQLHGSDPDRREKPLLSGAVESGSGDSLRAWPASRRFHRHLGWDKAAVDSGRVHAGDVSGIAGMPAGFHPTADASRDEEIGAISKVQND